MMRFFKRFRCKHIWRYWGSPLCATFIPSWPFRCEECKKIGWTPQAKFPNKESYLFYREKMGTDFKLWWEYFVSASLAGDYFVGESMVGLPVITKDTTKEDEKK